MRMKLNKTNNENRRKMKCRKDAWNKIIKKEQREKRNKKERNKVH